MFVAQDAVPQPSQQHEAERDDLSDMACNKEDSINDSLNMRVEESHDMRKSVKVTQNMGASKVSFDPRMMESGNLQKTPNKSLITKKDLPNIAQEIIKEKLGDVNTELLKMQLASQIINSEINDVYACHNPKLLEILVEYVIFHWDDIMECLVDDLLEEEVIELNNIDEQKKSADGSKKVKKQPKLSASSTGFQDFKSVDMRDILSVFEDYNRAEKSIKNRM